MTAESSADTWDEVVGQDEIVARLRMAALAPSHAYLFVGEGGFGTRAAARAFAAEVLSNGASDHEAARHRRLALADEHPAVTVFEREGAGLLKAEAEEIVRQANLAPVEGTRQIFVLVDFHLVSEMKPRLLKTIEEPPSGTLFVILADEVPQDLVTIASRCVRVDFGAIPHSIIRARLLDEGASDEVATAASASSGGDLERARLLAKDERLIERREFWKVLPERLDGTGATAATLAAEAMERLEEILTPLKAMQEGEMAQLIEQIDSWGQSRGGIKTLEAQHKREQRRIHAPEFKAGLAAMVDRYRAESASGGASDFVKVGDMVTRLCDQMVFNPNLDLALQGLIVSLPTLRTA